MEVFGLCSCPQAHDRQVSAQDILPLSPAMGGSGSKTRGSKDGAPPSGEGRPRQHSMGRSSSFRFVDGENKLSPPAVECEKTPEDKELIANIIRGNPHLQRLVQLRDEHIKHLVAVAQREEFQEGEVLMTEGDLSNEKFYVIAEGSFDVVGHTPFEIQTQPGMAGAYLCRPEEPEGPMEKKPMTQKVVCKGQCIGDRSMVFNQPRIVTATARERCTAWAVSQLDFKIVQNKAMWDIEHEGAEASSNRIKTPEEQKLLAEVLQKNANLQRLVPLNREHIERVVAVACREELSEGHALMYEGDLNAEAFYIVGEGLLEATGSEPFEVISDGDVSYFHRAAHTGEGLEEAIKSSTVRRVGRGHCFGEISMLHCAPRFATLKAVERTVLWVIDRASFQIIQMKGAEDHMRNRVKYLDGSEIALNLPQGGKEALAGLMDTLRFNSGEVMVREGQPGDAFYILYDGTVKVTADGKEPETLEASPASGAFHCFGEEAVRKNSPHVATVTAVSPTATVLVLDRNDFVQLWDQLIEGVEAPVFERLSTKAGPPSNELSLGNLETLGLMGCGFFGPVELVQHRLTKTTYALKTMSKGLVLQKGMRKSVLRERSVSMMLVSPFVIKLVHTFNEPDSYCMLLEAALGGDVAGMYRREGCYGSPEHAKYYIAGTVYALECLHRLKVIHRNINSYNLLISQLGHPKLTDFGLAKLVVGHTFTMCGTPDYMAPEVLAGTGHNRAVDWWSLGVMLFELLSGELPFQSDHPMRVYYNIMRGIARVRMPETCKGSAGDLIGALLKPQVIERLPMRPGGIGNVVDHSWYSGFDWQGMRTLTLKPPYVPKLNNNMDLRCFTARREDLAKPVQHSGQDIDLWEDK
mmetsp:Transcript_27429/g.79070  ORF Transcript_27429/g.79070 Transcript_27429/m.79070 type:complete len:864 (-) Transcript_27429:83-2674(-)